ncbi:MAG TPA: UDP-N-acetylmuramyl pentapeptide phosphotransferase [Clostridia bacterium]|nr:UDP-N-acetylmuramyl pentapeptide phosphotransferase [Clostridia bacterium]
MMEITAIIAVSVIISRFLLHNIIKMLYNSDMKCKTVNYRGKAIPAIGGIVFIPILLVAVLLLLLSGLGNYYGYLGYLSLVVCMGFIGVIDDLVGDKSIKGLIKHVSSTLKGRMTTGFLKAMIGLLASCLVSIGSTSTYAEFIVNVSVITLFANTLNLFDLRPGRAVKVFLLMSVVLLTGAKGRAEEAAPIIILGLAAGLYISYDLKEICMLGDTGANILGITLGYYSTLFLGFNMRLLLLGFLVFLNILSEKVSITEIIRSNRLLSYFDDMGRGQTGGK